jgi:hypothetical protein
MKILPPWVYAAAAGVVFAAGFGAGFRVESWRWSASELHTVKAQAKQTAKQVVKQHNESTTYEQHREVAQADTADREGTACAACSTAALPPPTPALEANLAQPCPPLPSPPLVLVDPDRAAWENKLIALYGDCADRHFHTVAAWPTGSKG